MILHSEGLHYPIIDDHLIDEQCALFCQACNAPDAADCTCEGPYAESDETDPRDIPVEGDYEYMQDEWDYSGEEADIAQNRWERAYWGD